MNQKINLIFAVILQISLVWALLVSGCIPQPRTLKATIAASTILATTPMSVANQQYSPLPPETENKTIVTDTSNRFTMTLSSNPTTGYEWNANFDNNFVNLIENKFIPATGEGKVGVGGEQLFTFIALKTGTTGYHAHI